MVPEWQTGIVRRIESVNQITRRFFIEIPKEPVFDFKAGQFITLDLPIHEQKNKRWRSYSIASEPDGTNVVELLIVLLEGGLGTTYLFNEIKEGSELVLRGPHGHFTLPETNGHDIMLVCTGTGIAPFRSMMRYLVKHPHDHKNIHLIFGCRTQNDLLYAEEMNELAANVPGFYYHPTLSREDWSGKKGYVHAIYEELCGDRQPAEFMLCGWRAMIDEAKERILGMGYDKKAIHLELYG